MKYSVTLMHPGPFTMPGNLMNQTAASDAGMKVNKNQIQQIIDAYLDNKLNKGRQRY
ncbi:hypothetical protein [Chitinophaga dinghuensis]|uniref:hypothetical protein n=1 Tax=Chitinophaga dinghuensis TaxID=1539050 RepID=UPI001474F1F0|nr:hypothetical protein [Chitinophaga dinghuensis]